MAARPRSASPAAQDTPPHIGITVRGAGQPPHLCYQHGRLHRPPPSASPWGAGQHHPPDRPPTHQHHPLSSPPISITSGRLDRPHQHHHQGTTETPHTHTSTAPAEQITPHHHHCQRWWTDPSRHQHHYQGAQQSPPITTLRADWPHLLAPPFPASLGEQPDPPNTTKGELALTSPPGGSARPSHHHCKGGRWSRQQLIACRGWGAFVLRGLCPPLLPLQLKKGCLPMCPPKHVGWGLQGRWGPFSGVPKASGRIDSDRSGCRRGGGIYLGPD